MSNTMKFYKVQKKQLVTLRVKIHQRNEPHYNQQGKSRTEACALARSGGFHRTRRLAIRAAFERKTALIVPDFLRRGAD